METNQCNQFRPCMLLILPVVPAGKICNMFKFGIHVHRWKKKKNKKNLLFFPYTKIAKQKIRNKKNFAKCIISQTSNTKEIREKNVKKLFAETFFWKEKFSSKIRWKKFSAKKKFREKCSERKLFEIFFKIILAFFLYCKKSRFKFS